MCPLRLSNIMMYHFCDVLDRSMVKSGSLMFLAKQCAWPGNAPCFGTVVSHWQTSNPGIRARLKRGLCKVETRLRNHWLLIIYNALLCTSSVKTLCIQTARHKRLICSLQKRGICSQADHLASTISAMSVLMKAVVDQAWQVRQSQQARNRAESGNDRHQSNSVLIIMPWQAHSLQDRNLV